MYFVDEHWPMKVIISRVKFQGKKETLLRALIRIAVQSQRLAAIDKYRQVSTHYRLQHESQRGMKRGLSSLRVFGFLFAEANSSWWLE